jgi:hypothetical protein
MEISNDLNKFSKIKRHLSYKKYFKKLFNTEFDFEIINNCNFTILAIITHERINITKTRINAGVSGAEIEVEGQPNLHKESIILMSYPNNYDIHYSSHTFTIPKGNCFLTIFFLKENNYSPILNNCYINLYKYKGYNVDLHEGKVAFRLPSFVHNF